MFSFEKINSSIFFTIFVYIIVYIIIITIRSKVYKLRGSYRLYVAD